MEQGRRTLQAPSNAVWDAGAAAEAEGALPGGSKPKGGGQKHANSKALVAPKET